MNMYLFLLLACTFASATGKLITFSFQEQEQQMRSIKNQIDELQIEVQKMHRKIETSFKTKKINVSKSEIMRTLKSIERTVLQVKDFALKIEKSSCKNRRVAVQLHKLMQDVFTLQKETSIMAQLENSFYLLTKPF